MNKQGLIEAIATSKEITKKEATAMVETVLGAIVDGMVSEKVVDIHGFGKFEAVHKPAREGRNPATGETMTIAAKTAPKLTFKKAVKDAVNA